LGCPRGDDSELPPPRRFDFDWLIGKPDAVFAMAEEFKVPAKMPKGGVKYQLFKINTNFDEDKWIQAAECKPGNRAVVHHIIAYVAGRAGNSDDGRGNGMLAAYAPGDLGSVYPPGAAKKVPKGATIDFQVHYTPNGVAGTDRSLVGMIFAKEPPKTEIMTRGIKNASFVIPPNAASHEVKSDSVFKKE